MEQFCAHKSSICSVDSPVCALLELRPIRGARRPDSLRYCLRFRETLTPVVLCLKKSAAVSLPIPDYRFRVFDCGGYPIQNLQPEIGRLTAVTLTSFTPTIRICKIYSFYASYKVYLC